MLFRSCCSKPDRQSHKNRHWEAVSRCGYRPFRTELGALRLSILVRSFPSISTTFWLVFPRSNMAIWFRLSIHLFNDQLGSCGASTVTSLTPASCTISRAWLLRPVSVINVEMRVNGHSTKLVRISNFELSTKTIISSA